MKTSATRISTTSLSIQYAVRPRDEHNQTRHRVLDAPLARGMTAESEDHTVFSGHLHKSLIRHFSHSGRRAKQV